MIRRIMGWFASFRCGGYESSPPSGGHVSVMLEQGDIE